MAATNVDLETAVRERRFREDLYHRLDVARVRMPSLAERREDIVPLARHFLASGAATPRPTLSPGAELALELAQWPGDVRELEIAVSRAAHRARPRGDAVIERRHLFPPATPHADDVATLQQATRAFQRQFVLARLRANDWNMSRTAREIDIARSHLYTLVDDLDLASERASEASPAPIYSKK